MPDPNLRNGAGVTEEGRVTNSQSVARVDRATHERQLREYNIGIPARIIGEFVFSVQPLHIQVTVHDPTFIVL